MYERPTRRIIEDTEQVLDKALGLILKCRASGLISWLLCVSTPADDEYLGLPPIAANEPILCLIWEQIAILCSGSLEEHADVTASLVYLPRDNDRYGKLIIEEGGVSQLLKLVKDGRLEGQENASRAVFAKILKEGHMKVQVVVAWAIAELAANYPKCQDHFAQTNTIRLLVSHLAFETIQEHSKYTIPTKHQMSIHTVVMSNWNPNAHESESNIPHPLSNGIGKQIHYVVTDTLAMKSYNLAPQGNLPNEVANAKAKANNPNSAKIARQRQVAFAGSSIKGREYEDPETKAEMKAMSARALSCLCAHNFIVCSSVTESRALLCFSVFLEKGPDDVQYYSAMALMEITSVAEQHSDLRRSAFKPNASVAKAVVD
nr:Armadillo repeat only 1 [Ipomoea batatas]